VSMPTIGKILEESQIFSNIILMRCASNGKLGILLENMKKDALYKVIVVAIMVGKNKFSIQWFTRQSHVTMPNKSTPTKNFNNVKKISNVVTITLIKIVVLQA
jgi:hypothetical protein